MKIVSLSSHLNTNVITDNIICALPRFYSLYCVFSVSRDVLYTVFLSAYEVVVFVRHTNDFVVSYCTAPNAGLLKVVIICVVLSILVS